MTSNIVTKDVCGLGLEEKNSDSFFFNDTATTEIYTLSLHDALPISGEVEPIAPDDRVPSEESPDPYGDLSRPYVTVGEIGRAHV